MAFFCCFLNRVKPAQTTITATRPGNKIKNVNSKAIMSNLMKIKRKKPTMKNGTTHVRFQLPVTTAAATPRSSNTIRAGPKILVHLNSLLRS